MAIEDQPAVEQQEANEPKPKRFSTTGKIIITLLVGFGVGAIGTWYYLHPFIGAKTEDLASKQPAKQAEPGGVLRPGTDRTRFSSVNGKFNFLYKLSWKTRTCESDDSMVYLAPSENALAKCNSDFGGQMTVSSVAGDQRAQYEQSLTYPDRSVQAVTVAGVSGKRITATVDQSAALGPEPGTKLVQYTFFAGGRTYVCNYQQATSGVLSQDVLADFDELVKFTLKFAS